MLEVVLENKKRRYRSFTGFFQVKEIIMREIVPSLDYLPSELLEYIASFLDKKSLCFFAVTKSRNLKGILTQLKKLQTEMMSQLNIRASRHQSMLYIPQSLYVWGNNDTGQLGLGESSNQFNLTHVKNIQGNILQVIAAYKSTFVLTSQGLFACGDNECGQLCLGNDINCNQLTKVINIPSNILQIAAGSSHTLILTDIGLYGCGSNLVGQLGLAERRYYTQLTKIENIPGRILKIAAGSGHTLILTTEGLFGCGRNDKGQLGIKDKNNCYQFERIEIALGKVLQIAAGACHTMVLTEQGLYACGDNEYGQLGLSHTNQCDKFTKLENITDTISQIAAGFDNTFILDTQSLWACGENLYGQLGQGHITTAQSKTAKESFDKFNLGFPYTKNTKHDKHNDCFIKIKDITGIPLQVAAGENHTLLLTDHGLYASGNGADGQLGVGRTINNCSSARINAKGFNMWAKNQADAVVHFPECYLFTEITNLPPHIKKILSCYRHINNLINIIKKRDPNILHDNLQVSVTFPSSVRQSICLIS